MKTLIVTGASRGIGAAIARHAAASGWALAVNYATAEAAVARVVADIEESGGRATAIQGDVGREADMLRLFEQAERDLGPIGGLVNNAGITGRITTLADVEVAQIEQVLAVYVLGSMLCAREAIRRMAVSRGGSDPDRTKRMAPIIPMGRAGLPEEIAAGVVWLLSPAPSYTNGAILEIGGAR